VIHISRLYEAISFLHVQGYDNLKSIKFQCLKWIIEWCKNGGWLRLICNPDVQGLIFDISNCTSVSVVTRVLSGQLKISGHDCRQEQETFSSRWPEWLSCLWVSERFFPMKFTIVLHLVPKLPTYGLTLQSPTCVNAIKVKSVLMWSHTGGTEVRSPHV
jgi:hypothetical protein